MPFLSRNSSTEGLANPPKKSCNKCQEKSTPFSTQLHRDLSPLPEDPSRSSDPALLHTRSPSPGGSSIKSNSSLSSKFHGWKHKFGSGRRISYEVVLPDSSATKNPPHPVEEDISSPRALKSSSGANLLQRLHISSLNFLKNDSERRSSLPIPSRSSDSDPKSNKFTPDVVKTVEDDAEPHSEPETPCQCATNQEDWYRTWPERGREKKKTPPQPESLPEPPSTPIPLDSLLESLPLVYDPVTKQLCIRKPPSKARPTPIPLTSPTCTAPVAPECPIPVAGTAENADSFQTDSIGGVSEHNPSPNSEKSVASPQGAVPKTYQHVRQASTSSSSTESPSASLQRGLSLFARYANSSFSSLSSLSTDPSLYQWGSGPSSETSSCADSRRQSLDRNDSSLLGLGRNETKDKRGFSFLPRSIFPWKKNSVDSGHSSPSSTGSWKLFSRSPRSESPKLKDDTNTVVSTSALILQARPSNLPAKSEQEEEQHRLLHERLMEAVKKKEMKEAQLRKKQKAELLRQEEKLALASRLWNQEIIPKWDTLKNSKKTKELWWHGLPPSARGKVWSLALGNELNITPELYQICLQRAQEQIASNYARSDAIDKEANADLIGLDVSRTFPQLGIFQKDGPYHRVLHELLAAYVCFRPDIGYVQGMSFLAAVLLLNMESHDAFVAFANILNKPLMLAFFRLDPRKMGAFYAAFGDVLELHLPKLSSHFAVQGLSPDLYFPDWIYSLYSRSLPLDVACRVWDLFCRDGEEFVVRTALGLVTLYQETLLSLDFIHAAQFLTKLPEDLSASKLFRTIEQCEKLSFAPVWAQHLEAT